MSRFARIYEDPDYDLDDRFEDHEPEAFSNWSKAAQRRLLNDLQEPKQFKEHKRRSYDDEL